MEFGVVAANEVLSPELLPPAQIAALMQQKHIVEDWLKALDRAAMATLSRGETLPGWKMVQRRATRKWASESETVRWLKDRGFEDEEILDSKLKSPAQIEKVVGKKQLPDDLVTKQSSGVTLAPEHDPRPAVASLASVEFAVLPPASDE